MAKINTFSSKLDSKSENLIYLLSLDSQQTVSDLARILQIPRNVVENRIKKLFDEGYIKPLTITNEEKRIRFTMLIKLKEINEFYLEKFKNIPGLIKLKETFGKYDISALFDVYSEIDKQNIETEVSNLLHENLLDCDIIPHTFEDTLGYKSFCHKTELLNRYKILKPKQVSLSFEEEAVLDIVKKHPNLSRQKLSEISNISQPTVREIMRKLQDNNLIRFTVDPNYKKLGLEFHNMFVKIAPGKKDSFEKYIIQYPRVHWVKQCNGKWDYILSVTARDLNELAEITKQIRTENKNIILEEATLISHIRESRRR